MEPPTTKSPCFVYPQANNGMYMWNQVIYSHYVLACYLLEECFVDGFGDIKNGEITINIVLL
jgi:hypothetical protein